MPISRPKIDRDPRSADQSLWGRLTSGWIIPYVVLTILLIAGGLLWGQIDLKDPEAEQIITLLFLPLVYLVIGRLLVGLIRWLRRNKTPQTTSQSTPTDDETDSDQQDL